MPPIVLYSISLVALFVIFLVIYISLLKIELV